MTTATRHSPTGPVGSVVRGAFVATLLAGLGAVVLGALVSGSAAALGAAIGATMVCAFFGLGGLVLAVVARLAPAASLLIALLTYTLKVVLIGLVFLVLSRSGVLDETVHPAWLGGTVIGGTVVWLTTQIWFTLHARQPVYDVPLPSEEPSVR